MGSSRGEELESVRDSLSMGRVKQEAARGLATLALAVGSKSSIPSP